MSTALNQLYKFLGKRKNLFLENLDKPSDIAMFEKVTKPSDILGSAFLWESTEQGHEYWSKIYYKLLEREECI